MPIFVRSFQVVLVMVCLFSSPGIASPLVMFDEFHAQQFIIGDSRPLDLSELAKSYRDHGYEVVSNTESLTEETLADVDVLVISGAFIPLSADEHQVVVNFVRNGGGLAIMLHIAPPVRSLLHALDVDFTNGTLRETSAVLEDNPLDFKVINFHPHSVTEGLTDFSIYGAWALRGTAPHVTVIAETSERGWVDLDRDNRLSKNDALQKFGVMVAGELGQGRYLVIGDDAVFQNRFFDQNNRDLALNVVKWLSSR